MELDLKKLEQDIATLRKNRENVPLELLKTKYKKPYAKLKEEIRAQFEIYMKELSLLGILKIGPDMTPEEQKEMEAGIQKIIDEETAAGHLRECTKAVFYEFNLRKAENLGLRIFHRENQVRSLRTILAEARQQGSGRKIHHRPAARNEMASGKRWRVGRSFKAEPHAHASADAGRGRCAA